MHFTERNRPFLAKQVDLIGQAGRTSALEPRGWHGCHLHEPTQHGSSPPPQIVAQQRPCTHHPLRAGSGQIDCGLAAAAGSHYVAQGLNTRGLSITEIKGDTEQTGVPGEAVLDGPPDSAAERVAQKH
jgi:hypothetical protein